MEFPRECVTYLIGWFKGGLPADGRVQAVQALMTFLAYLLAAAGKHSHDITYGSQCGPQGICCDVEETMLMELGEAAGVQRAYAGPVLEWIAKTLLPVLIERLIDADFVQQYVNELIEYIQELIEGIDD